MKSAFLALAAFSVPGFASAQCDLLNETFSSVQPGNPVTDLGYWTSTSPTVPIIAADPGTNSASVRFAANALQNATGDLTGIAFPDRFRITFDFGADVDSTFSIGCPAAGAFRASISIQATVTPFGPPPIRLATSLDTPGAPVSLTGGLSNTAEIQVNLQGDYSVLINGTMVHTGPWNPAGVPACGAPDSLFIATTATGGFVSTGFTLDNICIEPFIGNVIGSTYCTSLPNVTGVESTLTLVGSDIAASNDVTMIMGDMPPLLSGIALMSLTKAPNPIFVSEGILCLGGSIARYMAPGEIFQADASGSATFSPDLTVVPLNNSLVAVMAGETWNFQAWHRDVDPMGLNSANFTNAVEVTFN
ncbi:hypothetical protein Poly30_56300 [Planctomycetes bacterium Poly30]|uniref:Uncharacterized protein n=1 Tax=Saltatorellus ferox TaxID=2528018 RepID=A0A518F152_9BACT|nr:hypothetical protein Poly30_56300 [Planctomycetes bacterium Poly30]